MALSPLATIADLEARGVTVAESESDFVNVCLDTASAIVREAAGAPITETTSTITLEGDRVQRLRLPGPPVRSVSEVRLDGTLVPATDWKLASGTLYRGSGWQPGPEPCDVEVTYVHGLAIVPADLVDLVCRMAGQALMKFRDAPDAYGSKPIVQERIGDYSATYAYELTYSDMELPKYLRARLAARFGGGARGVRSL
ncbi:hypothetical protein [Streptomyces sp. NPDC015414]|uniref:hypothetical protein n=1 Tax=Streptomyces sp. NPDC015414 TaxID=3364957 RepID=UPI0036FD96D8